MNFKIKIFLTFCFIHAIVYVFLIQLNTLGFGYIMNVINLVTFSPWILFVWMGLPVMASIKVVIFFPAILPNTLGLVLNALTWLALYWFLAGLVLRRK